MGARSISFQHRYLGPSPLDYMQLWLTYVSCDGTRRAQPSRETRGTCWSRGQRRPVASGQRPDAPPAPIAQCWKTKRSVSGAERLRPLQTQPSLHIIRSFSTMNLPSLYFWLSSNASSWRGKRAQQRRQAPPAWARDGSAAHIFPAEDGLADVAVDVADRVQPGDEDALLPRPLGHVDAGTAARGVSGVRGRKPAPAERGLARTDC